MQALKTIYPILESAKQHTHIDSATYDAMYKQSIEQPNEFWAKQAEKFLDWYQPWDSVSNVDLKTADIKWFSGGKLNVSYNCIDRHLVLQLFLKVMTLTKMHILPINNYMTMCVVLQIY